MCVESREENELFARGKRHEFENKGHCGSFVKSERQQIMRFKTSALTSRCVVINTRALNSPNKSKHAISYSYSPRVSIPKSSRLTCFKKRCTGSRLDRNHTAKKNPRVPIGKQNSCII